MGKVTRHVEGRSKESRAKVRKSLGTLKSLTVQPQTRARYERARQKFYTFLQDNRLTLPAKREQLDPLLAEYVEHLWSSGEGRGLASDTVAGIQDLDPRLKGHLSLTWRLLKTWSVNEIPNRAPPIPETILMAMTGWAFFHELPVFGLSLLVGYYCLLRSGELFDVTSSDIFMASASHPAIISLGLTKGGKRAGAAESATLNVEFVLKMLWNWKSQVSPPCKLVPSHASWRQTFSKYLQALDLESYAFRPYSLRRGGATFWFQKHGSFDRLLVAGRWQAARTARIYLNEGLAMLAETKVPVKNLKPFLTVFQNSINTPLPKLERTPKGGRAGGRGKPRKTDAEGVG